MALKDSIELLLTPSAIAVVIAGATFLHVLLTDVRVAELARPGVRVRWSGVLLRALAPAPWAGYALVQSLVH